MVYPRGGCSSPNDEEYVSCYLKRIMGDNDEAVTANYIIRCKDKTRQSKSVFRIGQKGGRGHADYLKRTDALERYLDTDGSILIEVDILNVENVVWYPQLHEMPNDTLIQLYRSTLGEDGEDGEDDDSTADVVFDVGGKKFYAHKCILSLHAKTMYGLAKDHNKNPDNNDDENMITIQDMEGDIFESILEFVYCVRKPEIEDKDTAAKLLLAADRLGCTVLKLYVESKIVENFLDAPTAAEWLVLSDSHSCPLLKEASMKLYKADASSVLESEGWSQVDESRRLLSELLKFGSGKSYTIVPDSDLTKKDNSNDVVKILDVTSLRKRLLKANLDIDGNREILVDRLKEHYSSQG